MKFLSLCHFSTVWERLRPERPQDSLHPSSEISELEMRRSQGPWVHLAKPASLPSAGVRNPVLGESSSGQEEQSRFQSAADKRSHHNALERKRRDHIKDSFHSLRDSVPSLQGEKASRVQILDKVTEYIQHMQRKNHTHQQDINDLKRQNALLEQQVRALGKARSSTQLQTHYPSSVNSLYTNAKGSTISAFDGGSDSSSESEPEEPQSRKKLRMEAS
ncbi:Protein max [Sciurus carolinensis]|uniref:Protein max n=1 Tax=Sciurus carolinensis TaxID=30640 RepID=A0AA41MKQ0_SCICA|nr:Protein max [Sciurus carolinensis]